MDHWAGQEPINMLRVVLCAVLGLLILLLFGYTFLRWYQRGRCWRRPAAVCSLYHSRALGPVALEPGPPFSVSGALSGARGGYEPFHGRGP